MSANKSCVFGLHAVQALLERHPERVMHLLVSSERQDKKLMQLLKLGKEKGLRIEYASRRELDQLSSDENHQGVIAFCKSTKAQQEYDLETILENIKEPPFILVLDGVQDPHNLGACFRTADAAGVHVIIAPKDNAVGITPVVSKVACGAAETVPFVQVTNLARTLNELKERGIWIYGAAGDAKESLFSANLSGPVAIVLGAEGAGLRRLTAETCDVLLKIPMQGSVSSLNVSVATGIFLFEVVRARR